MTKRRSRGEGSLFYDQARGRWVGVISLGRDPETRRRIRRKASGQTKTECLEKLGQLRAVSRSLQPAAPSAFSVEHVMHLNPAGYYVYLLWGSRDDDVPLYVGKSANILERLGSHLTDVAKHSQVGWITIIRLASEREMDRREGRLIRRYRPAWNRYIPRGDDRVPAAG